MAVILKHLTEADRDRARVLWRERDRSDLCPRCEAETKAERLPSFCETHASWTCVFRRRHTCWDCELEWLVIPTDSCRADLEEAVGV